MCTHIRTCAHTLTPVHTHSQPCAQLLLTSQPPCGGARPPSLPGAEADPGEADILQRPPGRREMIQNFPSEPQRKLEAILPFVCFAGSSRGTDVGSAPLVLEWRPGAGRVQAAEAPQAPPTSASFLQMKLRLRKCTLRSLFEHGAPEAPMASPPPGKPPRFSQSGPCPSRACPQHPGTVTLCCFVHLLGFLLPSAVRLTTTVLFLISGSPAPGRGRGPSLTFAVWFCCANFCFWRAHAVPRR